MRSIGADMRIQSDETSPIDLSGALLRAQTEFHARLADETLRYLRDLQGMLGPAVPGTFIQPDPAATLRGDAVAGGLVELAVEVENTQAVHCVVTPALGPLTGPGAVTWFPELESSPRPALLPPGEVAKLKLRIPVPAKLPPGSYRGALFLQGISGKGIAVALGISASPTQPEPAMAAQAEPAMADQPIPVTAPAAPIPVPATPTAATNGRPLESAAPLRNGHV